MRTAFLSPHYDDETLFGHFICRQFPDLTVFVFFAPWDEDERLVRHQETANALGLTQTFWRTVSGEVGGEKEINLDALFAVLNDMKGAGFERVFAPMYEPEGGNPDHNILSQYADHVWHENVCHYATYSWPAGKTTRGEPVAYENSWLSDKLAALSCYTSQIAQQSTHDHFMGYFDEYTDVPTRT